jgi:hypothetical protein
MQLCALKRANACLTWIMVRVYTQHVVNKLDQHCDRRSEIAQFKTTVMSVVVVAFNVLICCVMFVCIMRHTFKRECGDIR